MCRRKRTHLDKERDREPDAPMDMQQVDEDLADAAAQVERKIEVVRKPAAEGAHPPARPS